MAPPFQPLFAWLEGHQPAPQIDLSRAFRPLMLSNPLDEPELAKLDPADLRAGWKWDGIRVQLAAGGGEARLLLGRGDDISGAVTDPLEGAAFAAVRDGALVEEWGGLLRRVGGGAE